MVAMVAVDPAIGAGLTTINAMLQTNAATLTQNLLGLGTRVDASITQASTKQLAFDEKTEAKDEKNWFTTWLEGKGKWVKDVGQKIMQFNKFMMTIARFMPIVKVFIAIILIFTHGLFFLTMLFALILAVILEIAYFIFSQPILNHILWFFYWFVTAFVPYAVYVGFYLFFLGSVAIVCGLLALANRFFAGSLKQLFLCQNSPAAWYKTPFFHKANKYKRGIMCSRPCRERYEPNETQTRCRKIPKEAPSYCPQSQIMRFYSGDGKKDSQYVYIGMKTKGNMNYLRKSPDEREAMLLSSFLKKKEFRDTCFSEESEVAHYNGLATTICSNIMEKTDISVMDKATLLKLKSVCNQAFCTSDRTYPFCTGISINEGFSGEDLIRSIVIASIGIMTFIITLTYVFKVLYMKTD